MGAYIFWKSSKKNYQTRVKEELEKIQRHFLDKIIVENGVSSTFENFTSKYENILSSRKRRKVFYCKNNRQLGYLLPILKEEKSQSIILTFEELNEKLLFNFNIEIIEIDLIDEEFAITKSFLEQNFYTFFLNLNTFYILIKLLEPTSFVLLEGCHYEEEIIASICKKYHVNTYCIQQGWPCVMHTRFKNMTYDYYLTWGEGFNYLWKKWNPIPHFVTLGYLYKSTDLRKNSVKKDAITFFFQAPIFIISDNCFSKMVEFAFFCAEVFPHKPILIREHPEYTILNRFPKKMFDKYANIEFVTHENLGLIFEKTEIGVSIFSSTIMEGLVYDVIPFIFNLTSMPSYNPNLEKIGGGIEVRTIEEAKRIIISISEKQKIELKNKMSYLKQRYFHIE